METSKNEAIEANADSVDVEVESNEIQTENENSNQQTHDSEEATTEEETTSEEVEESEQDEFASLREQFKLESNEDLIKKFVHGQEHITRLQNENKAYRELQEKALTSKNNLKELARSNPKLAKEATKLSEALEPIVGGYETEKALNQDKELFNATLEKYPEMKEHSEKLYQLGMLNKTASWDEIMTYGKAFVDIGVKSGSDIAKMKQKASVDSGSKTPNKPQGAKWTRARINKLSLNEYAKYASEIREAAKRGEIK